MAYPRIFIFICLVIVWVISTAGSASTVSDNSFAYSKIISIRGSPAGTQINYPVRVTLFNTTGINSPGVIFLGSGIVSPSWSDIRFSKAAGGDFYPYWIESTNETSVTIWVNVPAIPPEGVNAILRYGNSIAPDAQDGHSTFTFFDNFNGNSLNTAQWSASSGVTVSNGMATITATSMPVPGNYLSSTAQFGTGYRIVARIRPHDFGGTRTTEFFYASYNGDTMQDTAYYSHVYPEFPGKYYNDNGGGSVGAGSVGGKITGIFPNTWNRHEAIKDDTAITWIVNSGIPYTFNTKYYSGPGSVRFGTYRAGIEDVDWVFVGKYIYPEPYVFVLPTGDTTRTIPESMGPSNSDIITEKWIENLYYFLLGILLIGIFVEGWKAIKH